MKGEERRKRRETIGQLLPIGNNDGGEPCGGVLMASNTRGPILRIPVIVSSVWVPRLVTVTLRRLTPNGRSSDNIQQNGGGALLTEPAAHC